MTTQAFPLRFAIIVTFLAAPAGAAPPEDAVRQLAGTDGTIFVLPPQSPAQFDPPSGGSLRFTVTTEQGVRTYRAHSAGRVHTVHVEASGPPVHMAFDASAMRFRKLAPSIRVELKDYRNLEQVSRDAQAQSVKGYPQLGFAVLTLAPGMNPAETVERLNGHPAVVRSQLHFDEISRRPLPTGVLMDPVRRAAAERLLDGGAGGRPGAPWSASQPATAAPAKDSLAPDFLVYASGITASSATDVHVRVFVINWGAARSAATTLHLYLATDGAPENAAVSVAREIPPMDPKTEYLADVSLPISRLSPGTVYYGAAYVPTLEAELIGSNNASFFGVALDDNRTPRVTCTEPGRGASPGVTDPLLEHQWHLQNTGQSRFTDPSSAANQDLGMSGILADGPDGNGVRVAVVDTGLETCHPDLVTSVEQDASFNFNARSPEASQGIEMTDPFNAVTTGDHGTSVAGLIAASAANGIGGRGVAPGVRLRGYNALAAQGDSVTETLDSLGASRYAPDSTDVDIFNMSFANLGYPESPPQDIELVLGHGVRRLRGGRGAIYVKGAGNWFYDCGVLRVSLNDELGCVGSVSSPENNLPYQIVVGGLNAEGKRASYSSVGANLWVTARRASGD